MKSLYFINSWDEKKLVDNSVNEDIVINTIKNYVNKLNPKFKIYYIRSWKTKEGTMYDVGSHTEFFLLTN